MDPSNQDIRSLARMSQDPSTRDLALNELHNTLLRLLAFFVPDPDAFCTMLTQTGSLITGQATLWFMLRAEGWRKPQSLKLVCPWDQFHNVLKYISAMPGAHESVYPETMGYHGGIRVDVYGNHSHRLIQTNMGFIELIQSAFGSAFHAIPFQSATHLMNVLTPSLFISPYPKLNLSRVTITSPLRTHCLSPEERSFIDEYKFTCHTSSTALGGLEETCYNFPACCKRQRTFADEDCMVILMAVDSDPKLADTLLETQCTAWRLGGKACGNSRCILPRDRHVDSHI